MSIPLGELIEKVLTVFSNEVERNDLQPEEMVKCLASITVSMMLDLSAESVETPHGTLTLT